MERIDDVRGWVVLLARLLGGREIGGQCFNVIGR
jgi:hypothetical protein